MTIKSYTTELEQFRQQLYRNFNNRADVLMELVDALCSFPEAQSAVELSLAPCFRRGHASLYAAIADCHWSDKDLAHLAAPYVPRPKERPFCMNISNLDTDKWQVTLPGAGSIIVSGQATEQTVELSGAGSYNAENLASQKATIHSSGAGSAVVQVSDSLDVTIDGLGSVEYIGDPQVTQDINGVGSVRPRP